ncbi:MAG: hypothetical protein DRG37_06440, partial [Deltaproteobacteria bacterium]
NEFKGELNNVNIPYILFQAFPSLLDISLSLLGMLVEIPQLMLTYVNNVLGLPWWFTSGMTLIMLIYAGIKIYYIIVGRTPV